MTGDQNFWNRIARKYAARPVGNPDAYAQWLDRVRAHLTPEARVLELGCGTGSTALALAPSVAHITASDYAAEMVAIAREKQAEGGVTNLEVIAAGPGDGSLGPGPYDAVLAFNLLHLLPDLDAALAEIRGLLVPGGLMISKSVCLGRRRHALLKPLIGAMRLFGKAPQVRFLSAPALEAALAGAGFGIVETGSYPPGSSGCFIVARAPGL